MNLRGSLRIPACCLLLLAFAKTASAQEPRLPVGAPAADIVKDNLSRAAATPEQILELLGKDSGLMVEFKQVLAKDAGINGQILIEADLSEGAIAERLRSDLRCRVLATALLRSYGYLLPRINPDSDPAAEHNLVLRERAQEIQRASERRGVTQEQARSERTNGCNARTIHVHPWKYRQVATAVPQCKTFRSRSALQHRCCEQRTEKFQTICPLTHLGTTAM